MPYFLDIYLLTPVRGVLYHLMRLV